MDELSRKVLAFIRRRSLLQRGDGVVLAFSGGPDSVALALVLLELSAADKLSFRLSLAHLNHCLRGEESASEEAFCWDFADRHGLDLTTERIDVAAEAHRQGRSVEAAARFIRYAFLGRLAEERGAVAVATGHHADDVAESVLLRMLRGAAIRGLGAMAPSRPLGDDHPGVRLVRPLMETPKEDLLAFLSRRGQAFCTDSSNDDADYTRNRVRHRLIPMLKAEFSTFSVESLCALNESALEARRLLEALVEARWNELCRQTGPAGVEFHAAAYAAAAPPLRKAAAERALRIVAGDSPPPVLRAEHYGLLSALASRPVGSQVSLPGGLMARQEHGLVRFARRRPVERLAERELPVPGQLEVPEAGVRLRADVLPAGAVTARQAAERNPRAEVHLNLAATDLPLSVRGRQPGDRFCPLGASAPTRLKRFFIARKVPLGERDRTPLVLTGAGDIAWVVGHEIGECYRLTGDDHAILRLRAEPLAADPG
jgi:tRNA(Ile)-lysidine synthase